MWQSISFWTWSWVSYTSDDYVTFYFCWWIPSGGSCVLDMRCSLGWMWGSLGPILLFLRGNLPLLNLTFQWCCWMTLYAWTYPSTSNCCVKIIFYNVSLWKFVLWYGDVDKEYDCLSTMSVCWLVQVYL